MGTTGMLSRAPQDRGGFAELLCWEQGLDLTSLSLPCAAIPLPFATLGNTRVLQPGTSRWVTDGVTAGYSAAWSHSWPGQGPRCWDMDTNRQDTVA